MQPFAVLSQKDVPIQKFTFESVADTAAVNANGIKTLGSVSTFFINGKPADTNGLGRSRKPSS